VKRLRVAVLGVVIPVLLAASILSIDPLTRLSVRLTYIQLTGLGWENGLWSGTIKLSETASVSELVPHLFPSSKCKIIESKRIWTPGSTPCLAAVVFDGGGEEKIFLFQYRDYDHG
jgi:hypothetical protein